MGLNPKPERQIMFEEKLSEMQDKLNSFRITIKDAKELIDIGNKLLLGYEEVRDSRENWKNKYFKLKEAQS